MKKSLVFALLLAISACGGEPLEPFEPPVETSPFELGKEPWLLQYIESEMGVRQIPAGLAEYRIQFGDDGALQGQIDCNSLSGRYFAEGGLLTIESLSFTEIACGETQASTSKEFSKSLMAATQYQLDISGRLTVASTDGSQLKFERLSLPNCDEPLDVDQMADRVAPDRIAPDRVAPDRVASDGTNPDRTSPGRTAYTVTVAPEFDASSLVHELETDRPDFRLVDAGDCSRRFVASMNTNTLAMLQCRTAVEGIE